MLFNRKLKSDTTMTGLLPAAIALALFIISILFFGHSVGFKVLAGIIFIYSAFQFLAYSRVKSLAYLLSALYMLSFAIFLVIAPIGRNGISREEFSIAAKIFLVTTIVLLFILFYRLITRKVKWKGREIFELAAAPVDQNTNGFTDRPRPVGRLKYTKNDLMAFAHFMRTNHIALSFIEGDRVVLVPLIMGKEFKLLYRLNNNFQDYSRIAFHYNGEVTVQIAKSDYLEFRDQLSFDQLCESMGELFKEFMDLFLKNEGPRIIDRLDSLRISVFS